MCVHILISHFSSNSVIWPVLVFIWRAQPAGAECLTLKVSGVFDVFNVSGADSNSHSTLSDRQPLLPGVTSHGTQDDWTHTRPFSSHCVALVTPYSLIALLGKTCYTPALRRMRLQNRDILLIVLQCQNSTWHSVCVNTQ